MKIAYFTDTFVPSMNGIVTSILNSSKMLAARGHKIYIFTVRPKGERCDSRLLCKNVRVIYHEGMGLINYPDFALVRPEVVRTITTIKRIRPDVIHIHTPSLVGWLALFVSSVFDIPVVGTYHTFLPDFLQYAPLPRISRTDVAKRFTWMYTRRFYNRCDLVTTPSIAMKRELERHGIKRKVLFISNGVDLEKFRPMRAGKTGKTVLHVGRIGYEKNINVVLKAFRELLKSHDDAKLVIAGRGPDLEKLKSYAVRLGIDKSTRFLGPVPHDALPKLYSSADVFVTASTIETEGLVILEAMACGLPIVGVNALAVPYIVKHGRNGFIAKPNRKDEIADCLKKLLDSKELRARFGKESLRMVKRFSLDNVMDEFEKAYCSLRGK